MTLNEILNANGVAEDVVNAILAAMKENKIFTASEENLDIRYGKLKTDHDGVTKQLNEANATIDALKKSTKGQEEAQQKITAYEQQVTQLQQELADAKWQAEAKVGLLAAGAADVDYLMFKLEESMKADGKEKKLDDNGKIPGWDDLLSSLQTKVPTQFNKADDDDGYQVLNPNKLKGNEGGETSVTREKFAAMDYEERMALKQKNEKLYNSMVK